ncbi:MAG: SpoIVB peptidase S55 domain-containing protein [Clostridia bacterium]
MVSGIFSTVFFGLATAFFAYLSYINYYTGAESLVFALSAIAFLLFLLLYLPYKGKGKFFTKPFVSILTILVIIAFTYNCAVFLVLAVLCLILGRLFSRKKKYTHISFTDDLDIIPINYTYSVKIGEVIRKSHLFLTPLTALILVLTFSVTFPYTWWETKAFPVSLNEKDIISDTVLLSGNVTASVLYNETAMLIGGFFDIETEDGTKVSPCKEAGIEKGDVITHINDQEALSSDFITKGPTKAEIKLTVNRYDSDGNGQTLTFSITPVYSSEDDAYRIGINYYAVPFQLASTIQTMTFSYPISGYFAATGHSAEMPTDDSVKSALLSATVTGHDSEGLTVEPGEIIGDCYVNNRYGTFGIVTEPEGEEIFIAKKWQVHPGKAKMISTFEGGEAKAYDVYITGTYRIDGKDIICLSATDERIKNFGGVMRGMSGTPIIQDGRLAGALCNVDSNGFHAYAIYAYDMAHELYLNQDILKEHLTEE